MNRSKRRAILVLLLGLASSSAMAEWLKVYAEKSEIHYADPASMSASENRILMLDVTDITTKGKPFSVKAQREYDCQGKQVRIMNMVAYRGKMGEGDELFNNPNHDEWQEVQKKSALESLFKLACGKK